jgi:hypothetical protein
MHSRAAQERMTPYNFHCRLLFFQLRRTVEPAKVYFFDETHFNFETDEREYGRKDSYLVADNASVHNEIV